MIRSKKKIIFGLLLIVIVGGLIYYILNGGKSDDSSTESQSQPTVSEVKQSDSTAQVLKSEDSFSRFYASIEAASLTTKLDEQITVFAPNNKAFESLPDGSTIPETLNADIVNYHLVKGVFNMADIQDKQKLPTLNGQELVVMVEGENKLIVDAKGNKTKILSADLKTSTGIIHEIDRVLLPQ